ncbi:hypothetical protein [Pedobacter endophyticus]|uniref:Uncharacterized protein n=1 Tax=Pedobacter endophyticus TaxID=2789740 RepID=A0A7S9Q0J2_9SPHI|nr:hypothetical protein [Pedobacter endophyticus]QPH41438.1 hypothetical protein IZT61_09345 [Pedobacter endophyticus]
MKGLDENQGLFFVLFFRETKGNPYGFISMNNQEDNNENLPVEGQDFADTEKELKEKPSSHGEVANQKEGDFTELEASRMEHPPKHREDNGSSKDDVDSNTNIDQQKGVD